MKKVLGSLIVTLSLIVSPFVGYNQASAATAASTYLDMNETTVYLASKKCMKRQLKMYPLANIIANYCNNDSL
ncbi:hypothetical protein ACFRCQ_27720, partial [Cytobacillus firmus]|uniref:hypothetical protein n=1 Tax=Cytobacillus firmus TaxID=1399 RepID=UPI0036C0D88D